MRKCIRLVATIWSWEKWWKRLGKTNCFPSNCVWETAVTYCLCNQKCFTSLIVWEFSVLTSKLKVQKKSWIGIQTLRWNSRSSVFCPSLSPNGHTKGHTRSTDLCTEPPCMEFLETSVHVPSRINHLCSSSPDSISNFWYNFTQFVVK